MYLFAALIIAALSCFVEANPTPRAGVAIPITKHTQVRNPNGVVDLAKLRRSVLHTDSKLHHGYRAYEQNIGARHPSSPKVELLKRNNGSEPLVDYESDYWYGSISVGTPPMPFKVLIDTGSSDLFLFSTACKKSCRGHKRYNTSGSLTAKDLGDLFTLEYIRSDVNGTQNMDNVTGALYTDNVTVAGYTANTQTFGAVNKTSSGFNITNFLPDGVLGLAFQSISDFDVTPLFQTLVNQGDLPTNSFGMYLAQNGSELYLGGTNNKLYNGDFTYVPVTRVGQWETFSDALYLNGQQIAGSKDSVIDSGTALIVGDNKTVTALYAQIPGSAYIGSGLFSIPCTLDVDISIQFGGVKFPINNQTFIMGPVSANSANCVGGIVARSTPSSVWIWGDVFLRNVYTEFDVDNERIGFAKLV